MKFELNVSNFIKCYMQIMTKFLKSHSQNITNNRTKNTLKLNYNNKLN